MGWNPALRSFGYRFGDLSKWDVSKVTTMANMFDSVLNFNGDLSKWDVSKVTDMGSMFTNAENFNGDLSKWDVSKVTDMSYMFYHAANFKGDLSKWDVSKVQKTYQMFSGDSCSLCDHVPYGLQVVCRSSCRGDLAHTAPLVMV